jgi:SAM-dependent methyltransferase
VRSSRSYRRACRIGLPGRAFYLFGRSIGWQLWWQYPALARRLLQNPVSITRYFEFNFAWQCLVSNGSQVGHCLDVSSPALFSFYVANKCPESLIRMINPDARDLAFAENIARHSAIPRILFETKRARELSIVKAQFDAIWSISVIEHIAGDDGDDRDAVKIMWNLLRPGGMLILTVPTDIQAWDEFRKTDPYGTQPGSDGRYFFQRFYDERAIHDRIIASIGQPPEQIAWFGEKKRGRFHAYIQRWLKEGVSATFDDPLEIAMHYRYYDTHREMPGAGVCGLMFRKP